MSSARKHFEERYLALALESTFGGRAGCDVCEVVLARLAQRNTSMSPRHWWRRAFAIGAAAACLIGGLWLMVTSSPTMPATPKEGIVISREDGAQEGSFVATSGKVSVTSELLVVDTGWALINYDRRMVGAGTARIKSEGGRTLVFPGDVPDAKAIEAMVSKLSQDVKDSGSQSTSQMSTEETMILVNKKNWRRIGGIAVCVLAGVATVNQVRIEAGDGNAEVTSGTSSSSTSPFQSLGGADSKITTEEYHLIRNQADFDALWKRHTDKPFDLEKPDFNKNMVLAVFKGNSTNIRSISALPMLASRPDSEADTATFNVIRIVRESYQAIGKGVPCTPYGIFVLAKSHRALRVEVDIQNLKVGPPLWKMVKSFDAAGGAIDNDTSENPVAIDALGHVGGSDSDIDKPEVHIITSNADLEALLKRHRSNGVQELNAAGYDFSKEIVIAVFKGKEVDCSMIDSDQVLVDAANSRLVLRVKAEYVEANKSFTRKPYGFFPFRREEGWKGWTVVVEEGKVASSTNSYWYYEELLSKKIQTDS